MTQRSPVQRKIDDTSFEAEDDGAKAPKLDLEPSRLDLEPPPAWATQLLKSMEKLEAGQNMTNSTLSSIVQRVTDLEEKVATGEEVTARHEDIVGRLLLENATLRGMFSGMREDLNRQIDSDLRDHLVFYGVPGNEKSWEETAVRLAKWLGENVEGKTQQQYDDNIWRAHRGPANPEKSGPRPIFCKMNYRVAEHIKNKSKFGPKTGVSFQEQYSSDTQARVNEALAYRKEWKAKNFGSKAYIKFPAILKVQTANETSYRVEKSF